MNAEISLPLFYEEMKIDRKSDTLIGLNGVG